MKLYNITLKLLIGNFKFSQILDNQANPPTYSGERYCLITYWIAH